MNIYSLIGEQDKGTGIVVLNIHIFLFLQLWCPFFVSEKSG